MPREVDPFAAEIILPYVGGSEIGNRKMSNAECPTCGEPALGNKVVELEQPNGDKVTAIVCGCQRVYVPE